MLPENTGGLAGGGTKASGSRYGSLDTRRFRGGRRRISVDDHLDAEPYVDGINAQMKKLPCGTVAMSFRSSVGSTRKIYGRCEHCARSLETFGLVNVRP